MAIIQFEEIVERYLRPKALNENLDHSTWSDKAQVWVKAESSSADSFLQGTILEQNGQVAQVKLSNGKVKPLYNLNSVFIFH